MKLNITFCCGVLHAIVSMGSHSFSVPSLAFCISMSICILLRDAYLTLLCLLLINMPLTFLDFTLGFGRENDGSIGRRSLLLCLLYLVVTCGSLSGSSTSMIVGMGMLLLVSL